MPWSWSKDRAWALGFPGCLSQEFLQAAHILSRDAGKLNQDDRAMRTPIQGAFRRPRRNSVARSF